mgnify:FL=1
MKKSEIIAVINEEISTVLIPESADQSHRLTEAKLRKGDLVGVDDEIGVVNKVKGRVAYIKLPSSPGSFHPIEALRAKYKGKFKGKDLYIAEGKLNESMIGIQTKANFKPNTLKGELERAGIKGFQMNRLSVTMTALKLDKKDFEKAKKIIDSIPTAKIQMAKEGKLTESMSPKVASEKLFNELTSGRAIKSYSKSKALNIIDKFLSKWVIGEGKLTEARLSSEQNKALDNMNDWLPKGKEEEYLEILNQERAPAMIKFLTRNADLGVLYKKYKVRGKKDMAALASVLMNEGKLNEEDYKYKKQASKSFKEINDAMFNFRHSMGIKTLTNKDMKLKKKVDSLHQAIFSLQKEMKKDGLTEASAKDKFGAPPMNKWWTGDKDALMSAIYHAQRQLPPKTYAEYQKNWKSIVNQLQQKYPAPANIYKKKLNEADITIGGKEYNLKKSGSKITLTNKKLSADKFIFGNTKEFKAWADDQVEPIGGIQSSNFGINEAKVPYNFSEDELKRVLKLLGRNASTEVKMIKAFEKALGRKLTRDELFEVVNEAMDMNDPILVAIRARKTMLAKEKSAPKAKKLSTKQYYKLMDKEIDLLQDRKDAVKNYEELDSEMNQEAGQKGDSWSDADANRYGGKLNDLQSRIESIAKQLLSVKKAIMTYRIN